MTAHPKPIIHARDHEWGGADQTGIVWETVGGAGGGSLLTNAGVYTGSATTTGGLHTFPWTHSAGNTPLDLTSSFSPTVSATGVYAFAAQVVWAGSMPGLIDPTYHGPAWFQGYLNLDSGADGIATAGATDPAFQVTHAVGDPPVIASMACTWYIPVGATLYAAVIPPSGTFDFSFQAFVQQVA